MIPRKANHWHIKLSGFRQSVDRTLSRLPSTMCTHHNGGILFPEVRAYHEGNQVFPIFQREIDSRKKDLPRCVQSYLPIYSAGLLVSIDCLDSTSFQEASELLQTALPSLDFKHSNIRLAEKKTDTRFTPKYCIDRTVIGDAPTIVNLYQTLILQEATRRDEINIKMEQPMFWSIPGIYDPIRAEIL
jgi:hypothetical protein